MGPSLTAPGHGSNDEYPTFYAIAMGLGTGAVSALEAGGETVDVGDGNGEGGVSLAPQG